MTDNILTDSKMLIIVGEKYLQMAHHCEFAETSLQRKLKFVQLYSQVTMIHSK